MTKLLVIAASGMEWSGFDARTRSGALPNLAALRQRGFAGPLTGAPESNQLAALATFLTGVQPEHHGVWRSHEAWGGGLRPTGRASFRVSPVWARLDAAGVKTGSVGWPGIAPGATWAGVHLDETYAHPTGETPERWALPLHCAPAAVRDAIARRRVHPAQITGAMMKGLVPDLSAIDQRRPSILPALAVALARAATVQGGAIWLLEEPKPDAVFVAHGVLAEIRALAEARHEPAYAQATDGGWRFLDGLIGTLAKAAGSSAIVMIFSAGWRGRAGVFAGAGAGVSAQADFLGFDICDVAPSILGAFGFEDSELEGRPATPLGLGKASSPAPSSQLARPVEPDKELLRLAAADGFVLPPSPTRRWHADGLAELAEMLLRRDPGSAETLSAEALAFDEGNLRALRTHALALFATGRADGLAETAERLDRVAPNRGWGALARAAEYILREQKGLAAPWLEKAEAATDAGDIDTRLAIAAGWLMIGGASAAERLLDSVIAHDPTNAGAEAGKAMVAMARRDFITAEMAVHRAIRNDPARAASYQTLAKIYAETGRTTQAKRMTELGRRLSR